MIFVYDIIEDLCRKKNVTITKMCKDCGIARSTMSDYKTGRIKTLSIDVLSKLSDYFNVPISYLCGNSSKEANTELLKVYLFGEETDVTDEMWNDIVLYAKFIKEKYKK